MSNFRSRVRSAVRILATSPEHIKYRLQKAILDQLIWANVPEEKKIPLFFRKKHRKIINQVTVRSWSSSTEGDMVRATLHGKHGRTLTKIASEIWELYNEYEDYLSTGVIPCKEQD